MSMVKVYDKNGEMFEMTAINAHDVMTHNGWTTTAPKADKPVASKGVQTPKEAKETPKPADTKKVSYQKNK